MSGPALKSILCAAILLSCDTANELPEDLGKAIGLIPEAPTGASEGQAGITDMCCFIPNEHKPDILHPMYTSPASVN